MSFRRRALFLAGLFVAVSCSDAGNPLDPEGPQPPVPTRPEEVLVALTCTVSPTDPAMRCAPSTPGVGGASGLLIGGFNGESVQLTKIGHNVDADSMWFGLTLQNLTGQTLGADSLGVVDPAGIRIFFEVDPALSGPGSIQIAAPDSAFIYRPAQHYFHYAAPLADSAVSAPTTWKFKYRVNETTPGAMIAAGNFTFRVLVQAKVPHPHGWLTISPDSAVLQVGELDSLTARIRNPVGRYPGNTNDKAVWSSSDPSIVSVAAVSDTIAEITGVAEGTVWVHAVSDKVSARRDSVRVTVNNKPVVAQDSIDAIANVTDSIPAPRLQNNVTAGGGTVVADTVSTFAGGEAIILAGGGLVYRAPAGFSGKDTITYEVRDDRYTVSGKVIVNVLASNYWYVQANATGDGRDRSPFGTFAAAQAVAGTGDSIFVYAPANGTSALDGAAVLENGQALIGQGVAFDVTRPLNGHSAVIFDGTGAAPGLTRSAAGATVTLAQNNVIRGVGIGSTAGPAIQAPAPFISLFVRETDVSATGPALDLTTGTLDAVFNTLSAVNSTSSGLVLTGVDGSLTATGGAITITGAGGTAVSITGGVSVSYPGNVTQNTNHPLMAVASHTGTLAFGGALQATTGTGVQFNGASGTYTFNGAVTVSGTTGGFGGIDVRTSTGTFSFPVAASAVSNTSGPALYVAGGAPTLTYAGTLSNNSAGVTARPIYVDGITGGAVTVSGAVSNTGPGILIEDNTGGVIELSGNLDVSGNAGQGIRVQNNSNGADIRFTGGSKHIHSTLNIVGVYLLNNTGASIAFGGGGLNIDMPSGSGASSSGFLAQGGGTVTVTGPNNVVNVLQTAVEVANTTIGAAGISLRSVTSSSGTTDYAVKLTSTGAGGLQITGAGGVAGSGGSITAVDTAVVLSNVAGPVELSYLNVGTGAKTGVFANTFGTLTLTGTSLTSAGGPVLHLTGGALAGSTAMSAPNSNTNGAVLTNVTGSLTATGGGMSVSAVPGAGSVFEVNGGSVSVSYTGGLTGVAPTPLLRVTGGHTGTLAFDGINSMLMTGSPGMRFENADGTYNVNVTAGTTALSGDSAGIDILAGTDGTNGSQGTFQFGAPGNGFAITSGAGTAFNFQNSAADVTFHGGITKNGVQTGRMVDVTGQRSASAITFQTGTLSATSSNAASTGILLSDADGQVSFNGATTLGAVAVTTGDAGIDVENGSAGTLSFNGATSVTNAAGELIRIVNSAPTFTYAGSFQRTAGNAVGILAQNNTGGTITLNGDGTTLDGDPADVTKSLSTGTGNAVSLVSNGGTTFSFAGGMALAATSGAGLNATGGGTLTVTGAGNTVNTTGGGTGVNVQNTQIGGSGITLLSLNASGGGTNAVVLLNTGAGGFQVTGDGASDTGNTTRGRTTAKLGGGTVALGSGGTITGKTGDAVSLSTTGAVVLRNMVVQNGSADGIDGNTVSGLTVDNTLITGHASGHGIRGIILGGLTLTHSDVGNNATAAGVDATDTWNMRFLGLTGTATVQSSLIHHSSETVFGVINTSGSLTLGITNTNITDTDLAAPGTNGLQINAYGSSIINATLANDSIARTRARGVTASTETAGTGALSLTVTGTKFADNFVGLEIAHGSGGTATYNFDNNDFQRHGSMPINVNRVGSSTFSSFGDFTGTIQNNIIGTQNVANSGTTSNSADGIRVESNGSGGNTRVAVVNNQVRQIGQYGIYLATVDTKIGGAAQPNLEARVQGNTVTNLKASAIDAMRAVPGAIAGDHGRMCLDVISNTLNGGSGYGYRVRTTVPLSGTAPTPNILLEGWNGTDAFAAYAVNRPNTLTGTTGTAVESHGSGTVSPIANCNTP